MVEVIAINEISELIKLELYIVGGLILCNILITIIYYHGYNKSTRKIVNNLRAFDNVLNENIDKKIIETHNRHCLRKQKEIDCNDN